MRAESWTALLALLLAWLPQAGGRAADDAPAPPHKFLAGNPALEPFYLQVGSEIQQALAGKERWSVLPRPIDGLYVRPDQTPCFRMNAPVVSGQKAIEQARRWAAEQTWDGQFVFLYDTNLLARFDDELWMYFGNTLVELHCLSNGKWRSFLPRGGKWIVNGITSAPLARAGNSEWWWLDDSGAYRLAGDTVRPEKITQWKVNDFTGIVSDGQGRAVAWVRGDNRLARVGFFRDNKWMSIAAPEYGDWNNAAMRSDGTAVLYNQTAAIIVTRLFPRVIAVDDRRRGELPQRLPVSIDGVEVIATSLKTFAVTPNGSLLYAAKKPSGGLGLLRDLEQGARTWIDFDAAEGAQLAAGPQDSFVIFTRAGELLLLQRNSNRPQTLAPASEGQPGDKLLGCDHQGRVYFQRQRAVVVFSPQGAPATITPARVVAALADRSPREETLPVSKAAVDSGGTLWFITPDGRAMKQSPGDAKPHLADDRIDDAVELWPGENGSMLILRDDSAVALSLANGSVLVADSIARLAMSDWQALLAAAPRRTKDRRAHLPLLVDFARVSNREADSVLMTGPCLAVGEQLFFIINENLFHLRRGEQGVEVKLLHEGPIQLLGPLRSGELVLANSERSRDTEIDKWRSIADPRTKIELLPVASPPEIVQDDSLPDPASVDHQWLDASGALWLKGNFGNYRVETVGQWPLRNRVGTPQFESPDGLVWGLHNGQGLRGFEVSGANDFSRSVRPTYLQHLHPIAVHEQLILCLTADGLAWLHFDKDHPEHDTIVRRQSVHWGGPLQFIVGLSGDQLLAAVAIDNTPTLVAVPLRKTPK